MTTPNPIPDLGLSCRRFKAELQKQGTSNRGPSQDHLWEQCAPTLVLDLQTGSMPWLKLYSTGVLTNTTRDLGLLLRYRRSSSLLLFLLVTRSDKEVESI